MGDLVGDIIVISGGRGCYINEGYLLLDITL